MSSDYETIKWEVKDGLGYLTINRPDKLNAINPQVLTDIKNLVLDQIKGSDEAKVVIITGEGNKAFIAGADIEVMLNMSSKEGLAFSDLGHEVMSLLETIGQTVIAAINGFALGGGCELAMSCDLIYASDKSKFGQPEVGLGVIPGFGGTQRLSRLVGPAKAKELIYTGKMISAQEAKDIGLVCEIFPAEELMTNVERIAREIMSKGYLSVTQAKRVINKGIDLSLDAALELEKQGFAVLFDTLDQKEGMKAFIEKRKADFKNK